MESAISSLIQSRVRFKWDDLRRLKSPALLLLLARCCPRCLAALCVGVADSIVYYDDPPRAVHRHLLGMETQSA